MRNESWVWLPKVGDAGTSGAGAVPLRSAQLMEQQKNCLVKFRSKIFAEHLKFAIYLNFTDFMDCGLFATNNHDKVQKILSSPSAFCGFLHSGYTA